MSQRSMGTVRAGVASLPPCCCACVVICQPAKCVCMQQVRSCHWNRAQNGLAQKMHPSSHCTTEYTPCASVWLRMPQLTGRLLCKCSRHAEAVQEGARKDMALLSFCSLDD